MEPTSSRRWWVDALILIVSAILIMLAAFAALSPRAPAP
jgi:hypothetical protein